MSSLTVRHLELAVSTSDRHCRRLIRRNERVRRRDEEREGLRREQNERRRASSVYIRLNR